MQWHSLKLDLLLTETGLNQSNQRFKVYLTNSLEGTPPRQQDLYLQIG